MVGSDTYFLELSAHVSLKVAFKGYLRDKATMQLRFLGCSSKVKNEECDQKNRIISFLRNTWEIYLGRV